MNRLQQCIDALHAALIKDADFQDIFFNSGIREAIAIISRILSAEPTSEEIKEIADVIDKIVMTTVNKFGDVSLNDCKIFAKAALLTAFPQQDKL